MQEQNGMQKGRNHALDRPLKMLYQVANLATNITLTFIEEILWNV
jgi:hypothetical protein